MKAGRPTVLVAAYHAREYWNLPPELEERLETEFPEVNWVYVPRWAEDGFGDALGEATVLFGWHLPEEDFPRAKRLRWIHSPATGVRRFLSPAFVESPVLITCSRNVHAPFLAEHAMAWILAHVRRHREMERAQERRRWAPDEILADAPPETLIGRTLTVVGYGAAGRELAARARAFGMRVLGIKRDPTTGGEGADEVAGRDGVERFLAEADVVVNFLPNTEETRNFFHHERLSHFKRGAFFVSLGRGTCVDEKALALLLERRHLAGAGLDVFEQEPLPHDSSLWANPRVRISPHLAGVGHPLLWPRLTDLFIRNLKAFLRGDPLEQTVDKRAGY